MKNIAKKMMGLAALATLVLTNVAEVGAATESDFTFNADVRYSQWVTKSRMNDYWANTTHDGFAVYNVEGTKITSRRSGGKSELDYVPGLVAKAIIENVQYYSQYSWAQSWSLPFFYSIADYGNYFYNRYKSTYGSLDDLNASKVYFGLYELTNTGGAYVSNSIASTTKSNAQTALLTAMQGADGTQGIIKHNSTYKIDNTTSAYTAGHTIVEGGWWHKKDYKDEMWLDGSYMGPALFAQLRNYKGSNIIGDDWTIVYRQIQALWEMCWNPTDKLLYHAFAAEGHKTYSNTWAGFNPTGGVYHSASYWGRACGWYLLALVDILEQMDKAGLTGTDNYNTLKGHLADLCEGLAARQDATSGCWYQILDEDGTFHSSIYNNGKNASKHSDTYNYIESSASALFTAGYLKALRLGYIPTATYEPVAKKAYAGLVNNFFAADGNEGVHLFGSCRSAGLGGAAVNNDKWRDGSKAYYLLGHDVARVAKSEKVTEGKILGAFILAATEYERLYQNNAVLFEKDLAPAYDLEAGDKISCPASGSGANITYQWYRNGVAVDGATNATIAPKASGAYYCKATSGSTTITSSTAQVAVAGDDTSTPVFTTNLPATTTATAGVAKTLTVAADHADGYQWYSNTTASNTGGQAISGATEASYTFTPAATGTLYYYCVATNSNATGTKSVASSVCTVTVSEAPAGPTVLYSTDFSNSEWSGITSVCAGKNAANETHNGITFHSYSGDNAGKPFEISQSDGTMTWCNNNMGDNYWIAIPVTGVNGSLTITVDDGNSNTNFNYVVKQETSVSGSPGSGSNATEGTPATVTVNNLDKSDYVVYLGRQGSGLTTLTSITITTPASSTPTPTTYTVSYNMNGHGDAIASVEGVTALPSTLPIPEATGYTFGGWYTNSGLTSAATAGASISADTELYAKWTANTYSVHFNANGGEGSMTNESFTYGIEKALTANAFTRTGYKFDGWATSAKGTKVYDNSQSVSNLTATNGGTVDLYAHWTEKAAATVSITPTSGNVTVGSTLDISSYVTAGSSTGVIGYSTGDATKATVTNAGVITGVAEGSATIYVTQQEDDDYKTGSVTFTVTVNATPTPATNYTVKFWNGETQFGDSQTIGEGSTVSAPTTNPTKEGYTFKGWALESGSTARVLFPYPVYEDVNFYAVWSNSTSGGGGGNFSATATATLSVAADASNTEITSTNASISGGSMYVSNGQTSAKNLIDQKGGEYAFTMTNNNTFFKVTLDKALIAGDKIKADIYGPKINSKNEEQPRGLWMSTATSRPDIAPTATLSVTNTSTSSDAWLTSEDYTVTKGDGICGETTFYIYRATANSTYFTDFTITTSSTGDDTNITLETVSDYEDFESYAGEGKTVTFKRSFNNGKWTTLVLPFSATTAQVIAAFEYPKDCEFANIKSMTVTAQGTGSIRYVTTSSITANTPILAKIRPNDGLSGKEGFTADEYKFTGVPVVNPESADAVTATSTDGNVTMYGVYKNTASAYIDKNSYFLSGGKFYDWSWLSNMTPFTAYIVPQTTSGNALKGLTFEEDSATGIINLNVNPNRNSLSTGEGWGESFNLAGQKVGKEYKGMVIKKGKKVIKK